MNNNASNKIKISIPHHEIKPKSFLDKPLMELASNILQSEIRSIQKIRMMLGVTHVRNICTMNNIKLDTYFFSSKLKRKIRNTEDWLVNHHVTNSD